ncbi:MAG: leucine efflux protein LeuE [Rhodocyclaceae bacterium]|nr:leucine efflux protein LeuE [Rhodocyclaceae bacterium]
MTLGITDLATFILGTIFIVLLPGPNSLYVLAVAAQRGIGAGYRGACGIFVGDFILMVLSATGAASLLRTTPWLFMLVKSAGAIYLAWIGVGLLRAAWKTWRRRHEVASGTPPQGDQRRPFRTALMISLMNPKAILFFISFFIQFVDPAYPHPELSFALLGLIVQICSAAYLSLLIFAGARLAAGFRRHRRSSALATGGGGGLFLGGGGKRAGAALG